MMGSDINGDDRDADDDDGAIDKFQYDLALRVQFFYLNSQFHGNQTISDVLQLFFLDSKNAK